MNTTFTTVQTVTETEMAQFHNGFNEFMGRMATSIVAQSEQVKRIDDLTRIVNELKSQVQALTNTINDLRKERDLANQERDKAIASEREAWKLADAMGLERDQAIALHKDALTTIATTQEAKVILEVANADLVEMNAKQTRTLDTAVRENQDLQERIKNLNLRIENDGKLHNEEVDAHFKTINTLEEANRRMCAEVKKLSQMLSVAKAVLEGVPLPERPNLHAVS